jgi:hypothetical protein
VWYSEGRVSGISETLKPIYQTTWLYNPASVHVHVTSPEEMMSNQYYYRFLYSVEFEVLTVALMKNFIFLACNVV